jgi:hypothetical protein
MARDEPSGVSLSLSAIALGKKNLSIAKLQRFDRNFGKSTILDLPCHGFRHARPYRWTIETSLARGPNLNTASKTELHRFSPRMNGIDIISGQVLGDGIDRMIRIENCAFLLRSQADQARRANRGRRTAKK